MSTENTEPTLTEEVFFLEEIFSSDNVDLVFDRNAGEYILTWDPDADLSVIKDALPKGTMAIVDQYFDATLQREVVIAAAIDTTMEDEVAVNG